MSKELKDFLTRLAIEPDRFSEFVANPKDAADRFGLSDQDQAVLFSGDQNRIYLALTTQDENRKAPPR